MQRLNKRCSRASSQFLSISGRCGVDRVRAIAPIVDGVAQTYAGKLKVAKVDVDHNAATPSRYGIRGIPALLFFKGGKVADQVVGYASQDVIEEKVQRLLA